MNATTNGKIIIHKNIITTINLIFCFIKGKKKKRKIFVSNIYGSSKDIIFLFSLFIYQIINFSFKVVRLQIANISRYLRQSLYLHRQAGKQIHGPGWGWQCHLYWVMGWQGCDGACSIYLSLFLKKKIQLLSCRICMHLCKCTNFLEVGISLKLL